MLFYDNGKALSICVPLINILYITKSPCKKGNYFPCQVQLTEILLINVIQQSKVTVNGIFSHSQPNLNCIHRKATVQVRLHGSIELTYA